MPIVRLKEGVNPNISVEFAVGLGWVEAKWVGAGLGDFVITSLKDGDHMDGSAHKQDKPPEVAGVAADIRTWQHWMGSTTRLEGEKWRDIGKHSDALISFARMLQQHGFAIVLHPDWLEGTPHLHVAMKSRIFYPDT